MTSGLLGVLAAMVWATTGRPPGGGTMPPPDIPGTDPPTMPPPDMPPPDMPPLDPCPVGTHRNMFGLCVPNVVIPPIPPPEEMPPPFDPAFPEEEPPDIPTQGLFLARINGASVGAIEARFVDSFLAGGLGRTVTPI